MDYVDSRFPRNSDVVLADVIQRWSETTPNEIAAVFRDDSWTYAQLAASTWSTAHGLMELGVSPGDFVLSWLPNGKDSILTWLGANAAGAAFAPINTAYRGRILEHAINITGARVMVAHAALLDRLEGLVLPHLRRIVVVGEAERHRLVSIRTVPADVLASHDGGRPRLGREIGCWDIVALILTSGTTGPSKGVLCPYLHHYQVGKLTMPELGSSDRFFVCLPLFHLSGTSAVYTMLERGGSFAITDGFRTKSFWADVRELGVTAAYLMGGMASFLLQAPASADDADTPLRLAACNPMIHDRAEFTRRFGVALFANYGSTEVPVPLRTELNPSNTATCGRPTTNAYELRLVDDFDREVGAGEPGELIVRHAVPWVMNVGYKDMPEATAAAWRNGWFHTGDILRRDMSGNYYFVDRKKDAVRRRGENVSSLEVEREIMAHAAVAEAAVVGVTSAELEEDIKAVVVLKPGTSLEPAELIGFLIPRLPYFMVPRYVEFVEALPRTESQKVKKFELRADGVTAGTWDRERAGIHLRGERFA